MITGEMQKEIKINFITQWDGMVFLNYKIDDSEWKQNSAISKTNAENKGSPCWNYSIKNAGDVEFYFSNEKGEKAGLGRVIMSNTGDGYAEGPENFKTSFPEIWVKEGIIYTENPLEQKKADGEIVILTINLHTYQETKATQAAKFDRIVTAIIDMDADIVALQECAQNKYSRFVSEKYGKKIRRDNMAKIITDKLAERGQVYDYYWDWSHYGWDKWEEGCAVLAKHKINHTESKYISRSSSKRDVDSRNVVMAVIEIAGIEIAVYSIHTGWWERINEPFREQFTRLDEWARELEKSEEIGNTLLCGDFNNEAGSVGYSHIANGGRYIDTYYEANKGGFLDPTIGGNIAGWENGDPSGKRIDYIFLNKGSGLKIKLAQRTFTEQSYGRVSDHNGQYVRLELDRG